MLLKHNPFYNTVLCIRIPIHILKEGQSKFNHINNTMYIQSVYCIIHNCS